MIKYMFKCQACKTLMSIETDLKEKYIHMAPPCPCGKNRMLSLSSYEYAYGDLGYPKNKTGWDF